MCASVHACVCVFGVGVTPHAWNGGCRKERFRKRSAQVSRLSGWRGAVEVEVGGGGGFLFSESHIYIFLLFPSFQLTVHSSAHKKESYSTRKKVLFACF